MISLENFALTSDEKTDSTKQGNTDSHKKVYWEKQFFQTFIVSYLEINLFSHFSFLEYFKMFLSYGKHNKRDPL